MSQKKPPMNLSDHIKLAVRIELARLAVMDGLCEILQHHVRKDSREYRKMRQLIRDLDQLKCWMDDIICGEKPDGIGRACINVYYDTEGSLGGLHRELSDVFHNYAVRHAMRLLDEPTIETDEITLTRFDSHAERWLDESDRDDLRDKCIHVKAHTGYVYLGYDGMVSRRPPEDEINPSQAKYALTPCQIRDFCEDAMKSGRFPTDKQIESLVG